MHHRPHWNAGELEEADVVALEELDWVGEDEVEEDAGVDAVEDDKARQALAVPVRKRVRHRRAPVVPDHRARGASLRRALRREQLHEAGTGG